MFDILITMYYACHNTYATHTTYKKSGFYAAFLFILQENVIRRR